MSPPSAVRRYYDDNTPLFLRFGAERHTQTIHRAVWAPGVTTHTEALNYSNVLVLKHLHALPTITPLRFADLGCGVGGTLRYVLPRLMPPSHAIGLTLSPMQATLARHNVAAWPHCHIIEGDYVHLPLPSATFDLIFSIEAYLHAPRAADYLAQAARALRPSGRLILCDDFLGTDSSATSEAQFWVSAFTNGWLAPDFGTLTRTEALARTFGLRLIEHQDLTTNLKLHVVPHRFARALIALLHRLPATTPFWASTAGSIALQICLQQRWVRYQFVVFQKAV